MINGWNRPGEKPPKDGEMCVIIFRHDGTPENMDAMGLAIYNDGKGWNITEDVHGNDIYVTADEVIWWHGVPKVPSRSVIGG